ncbi:MAG: Gfo/Idh/MocA family oxidoreductase [Verrucomicrobiota bacterium]
MTTRRNFLAGAASASAVVAAPAIVRGQNLNSKLQLASIGSDGKGFSDIRAMSSHNYQKYVAFCDVDLDRTLNVKKLSPETPIYQDFREMFAEKADEIDAVTVSTPDHMHAYCSITAMNLGKHVYCQKPLTHNVWENRKVMEVARDAGVITRMGNQIHSHKFDRTAVQLVQSGRIGKVKKVESWVGTTGHGKSGHISRPKGEDPIPDSLNWESWIGVAPMRPYSAAHRCYHPWGWRDWQDFGSGAIGDFGCHILDPVFAALEITGPSDNFFADHSGMNDEVWPAQSTYRFTVPGTEYTLNDQIEITWSDGGRAVSKKGSHIPDREQLPRSGSFLVGETGTLLIPHIAAPKIYLPEGEVSEEYEMADDRDHYHDWIDGCILKEQPSDGFEYGGRLTEVILLANIAIRFPKEKLTWDAEKMEFTNLPEANAWLSRQYREGWDLQKLVDEGRSTDAA